MAFSLNWSIINGMSWKSSFVKLTGVRSLISQLRWASLPGYIYPAYLFPYIFLNMQREVGTFISYLIKFGNTCSNVWIASKNPCQGFVFSIRVKGSFTVTTMEHYHKIQWKTVYPDNERITPAPDASCVLFISKLCGSCLPGTSVVVTPWDSLKPWAYSWPMLWSHWSHWNIK